MKKAFTITLLLACSCTGALAQGKFHGDLHLDGGTNFHTNPLQKNTYNMGGGNARIGYSTDKITIDLYGNISCTKRIFGTVGMNIATVGQDSTKKADLSADMVRNLTFGTGVHFQWTPSEGNTFKVSYSYTNDRATPLAASVVTDEISDKKADRDISFKETDNRFNSHKAGINYTHKFDRKGRMLEFIATFKSADDDKLSSWTLGKGEGDLSKIKLGDIKNVTITRQYRNIPSSEDMQIITSVKYAENAIFGVKDLDMDATLLYDFSELRDHQASENFKETQWVDSVEVREDFIFRTARLIPMLHINYKVWKYEIDASYSPEYYAHKLDSDKKKGKIDNDVVSHFFSINNTLVPWEGHEFKLGGNRSEIRPGYLEICWFPRQSPQYANEIYQGNEKLLPTICADAYFSYKYTFKRFSTLLDIGHNYTRRKIEQTYNNDVIDGREYRIFTWINGGRSHETNVVVKLSWNGKQLSATTRARLNYYHGTNDSGDETHSGDYNISGDIKYRLKTWTFSADAAYQSDRQRNYNTLGEIIKCNARISKSFGKFGIYLQGHDLFDSPIVLITKSEDGSGTRYEQTRKNNRIFLLGLDWSF